jgi:predicted RecB family endonuclease
MSEGTAAPADIAAKSNYWTLSITDLDGIIDRLEARIDLLVQTGGKPRDHGRRLREAASVIREVRDELLAENYDANRKGKGVVDRARRT